VTRQRTGFTADPAYVGRYQVMSVMTRLSICFSGAAEARKGLGADPSPLFNYQVESILPTLLLPILLLS
jgi:hypothetical protein